VKHTHEWHCAEEEHGIAERCVVHGIHPDEKVGGAAGADDEQGAEGSFGKEFSSGGCE